jgi:hypothetical protein
MLQNRWETRQTNASRCGKAAPSIAIGAILPKRFSLNGLESTRRLLKPLEILLKLKRSVHCVVLFCGPYISTQAGSSDGIEFLNAQEEYALVKLYVDKIPPLCTHFRFNDEVESTAMTYLKRFYLNNTAMDWHPKNVMWVSKIAALSILSNV